MKKLFSLLAAVFVILAVSVVVFDFGTVTLTAVVITTLVLLGASYLISKADLKGAAYMAVTIDDARGEFTNAIVAFYAERPIVTSFLRSFFPSKYTPTKLISFAVKRGTETVAVDILRGTGTNMNKKTRSTIKTLEPPLYNEGSNVNELDSYDVAWNTLDVGMMANLAMEQAEILIDKTNKIERAYEKQCADVLQSGIITLVNHDNIDFKRRAGSMVDLGAPAYWTVDTVDPMVALQAAGAFIREEGKAQGGIYNVIMGGSALNAMLNNPIFQKKYDLRQVVLGEIREPQRNAVGGTLHGQVTAGSYKFNVWTYPEGYENAAGEFQYYIEPHNIVVLPEVTQFVTSFALVPQLPGDNANQTVGNGEYVLREYIDTKHQNHTQEVLSAGAAIPVAIDQIYTAQVVAEA